MFQQLIAGCAMADESNTAGRMVSVSAELTAEQLEILRDLAGRRGVSANTVLQQAIKTEKLFADNVKANDEVLIRHPDNTYARVLFKRVR
jgi:hypothetical protein